MFDNDCGYFLHSISDYSTDNLFKNYVDTSTVLNGLIKRHYNKLDTSINRSLQEQLKAMHDNDQFYRNNKNKPPQWDSLKLTDSLLFFKDLFIDSLNKSLLEDIISKNGFPTFDNVGFDGVYNAWIIAQHADFDTSFQIFYLQSMEKLLPSYRINISNYNQTRKFLVRNSDLKTKLFLPTVLFLHILTMIMRFIRWNNRI